ncbi:transposase [Aquimarina sp. I32.4]|uniref:transposase n=1 Tax=Aquimarina sp. I32.4 TaxID=2053903 RepID=UPI000CDE8280|nr:transposase [Aquimarina sp. I32.4]
MSGALAQSIALIDNWEKIILGGETAYRGEVTYTPFTSIAQKRKQKRKLKKHRLVVTKVKRNDFQINAFTNEAYNYSAVLTNDWSKTKNQVTEFYNQRGAIEKEFDVLKNDFGWNNLPFSKLEQNTVFLLFSAICRNLYHYIITLFSNRFKYLRSNFRIKKFIFRFITIPAKWVRSSRQQKLRLYGDLHFKT